jgi:hypothetical protein
MSRTPVVPLALVLCALGMGCAPTLFFNQTFLVPEDLRLSSNGYASLKSTGESFDFSPIKAQEPKAADRIILIKIRGSYFVVGEAFRRVWRLWGAGKDKAKFEPIGLGPGNSQGFVSATMEVSGKCALLKWQRGAANVQAFINSDGDVDEKKCSDE